MEFGVHHLLFPGSPFVVFSHMAFDALTTGPHSGFASGWSRKRPNSGTLRLLLWLKSPLQLHPQIPLCRTGGACVTWVAILGTGDAHSSDVRQTWSTCGVGLAQTMNDCGGATSPLTP
eukprot:1161053-Pelagomonas_calceolata.AAC.9